MTIRHVADDGSEIFEICSSLKAKRSTSSGEIDVPVDVGNLEETDGLFEDLHTVDAARSTDTTNAAVSDSSTNLGEICGLAMVDGSVKAI